VETDLGFMWQNPILSLLTWRIAPKRVLMPLPRYRKQEVLFLKQLLEAGQYRAVIDRRYRLEQVVEATRYVESEQKIGNVILAVGTSRDRQPPGDRRPGPPGSWSFDYRSSDGGWFAAGEEPAGRGGRQGDADDHQDEGEHRDPAEVADVVRVGRNEREVGAGDAEERA
jgi:hypothetical protein